MKQVYVWMLGFVFVAGCSGCATGTKRAEMLSAQFMGLKNAQGADAVKQASSELKLAVPKSEAEILVLAAEMEGKAYGLAQEVMSKITDKTLVPILLKVLEDKKQQLKNWSEKDLRGMNEEEGREAHRKLGNVEVIILVFGQIKDERTISALKEMLDYELLRYPASTALSRIGDEKEIEELLKRSEQEKNINISGDKALQKMMKEINDPNISVQRRAVLTNQIKGSAKPEVAEALKELALNSPYEDVREQAGLALVNSIVLNPNAADPEFLIQWVEKSSGIDQTWATYGMAQKWDIRYVPILIEILGSKTSLPSARANAADILGSNNVTEAVPALEKALLDDDSGVRSSARQALSAIVGDTEFLKRYFNEKFVHPSELQHFYELKNNQNK